LFRNSLPRLSAACAVLAALLVAAALPAAAAEAGAAPVPHVIGEFKNWVLVCADVDGKPATPEECFLNDATSARQDPPSRVAVAVGLARGTSGGRVLAIQFAFKPGVDRTAPFQVQIDGTPVLAGSIADCTAGNCQSAVAPVAPQLLQEMKRGTTMSVAFKTESGEAVSAPVSLAGFTAAVGALTERAPVTAAAASAQSSPAPGVPAATAKFRDWSLYCADTDDNAATPQLCRLNQVVMSSDPGKSIMAANIAYSGVQGSDKKELVLQLMFPPATDQEAGVTIMVDGKELGSGPVRACTAEICHALVVLTTEVINLMKQGSQMTVVFTLKEKGKIAAPVSLLGITAAIDALIKRS
jgi:invasion protein IalB